MKKLLLSLLLLASPLFASTAQMDGNDMQVKCRAFWGGDLETQSATLALDTGYCAGYVAGISDLETMQVGLEKRQHIKSGATHFCRPETVPNAQVMKVIGKWLNDNPDKLHWRADTIIVTALSEAFPCK